MTSGPLDPLSATPSAGPRRHKWKRIFRIRLRRGQFESFSFILFFKKTDLTTTLTAYNFLMITPNELILSPTSLKFNLVYFKIYLKKFQTTLFVLF